MIYKFQEIHIQNGGNESIGLGISFYRYKDGIYQYTIY